MKSKIRRKLKDMQSSLRWWWWDVEPQLIGYGIFAVLGLAACAALAILVPVIVFIVGVITVGFIDLFLGTVDLLPFEILDKYQHLSPKGTCDV